MIEKVTSGPQSAAEREALGESEREMRFALEAGRFGLWRLDLATGELTTSKTCRTNFGRDPELPFSYDELRAAVHPGDTARMAAAVARSISTGADYDIDYRVITPTGATRWVTIRAQPAYADDGTPLRMAGVSIDVTERWLAARRASMAAWTKGMASRHGWMQDPSSPDVSARPPR